VQPSVTAIINLVNITDRNLQLTAVVYLVITLIANDSYKVYNYEIKIYLTC